MRRSKQSLDSASGVHTASPVEVVISEEEQALRNKNMATVRARKSKGNFGAAGGWTGPQTEKQMRAVEDGILGRKSEWEIYRALKKLAQHDPDLGIGPKRIASLKARILEQYKAEHEKDRPTNKHQQIRTISRLRMRAEAGTKDKEGNWIKAPDLKTALACEQEIAKLQGNYEPLLIDVDLVHRDSITAVLSSMSDGFAAGLISTYDRIAQMAKVTGTELPRLVPAPQEREQAFTVEARGEKH